MIWIGIGLIAAALLAAVYRKRAGTRQQSDKSAARKVVPFSPKRGNKRKSGRNKCSFCKKNAPRLSFYADENGKAVGVCDKCRPLAERRALLRL